MHLHPWSVREIHIHVPGDIRQWCVDNGEGDPIPCGAGDAAEERACLVADMLNLGCAASAKGDTRNPITDAAKAIYAKCGEIEMLIRNVIPSQKTAVTSELTPVLAELAGLQALSLELQKRLMGE